MAQITMVQDKIADPQQISPAYFDRAMFFGDGVYEVIRSYNGRIFAIQDHLDRFRASLNAVDIKGIDIDTIRRRILKAFKAADIKDASIYFHVTRGTGPRSHIWPETMEPTFFLTVSELPDDTELKEKGVSVSTYPDLRWKRCDIKSLNLLPNVLARQDAAKKNCYEAILVNDKGFITEGSGSAFFAIFGSKLYTSPLKNNILPSISRKYVLKAAGKAGLKIVEKNLKTKRAVKADEMFIAVTTKDIVPVIRFDGHEISGGRPGPLTKKMICEFTSFTLGQDEND